MDAFLLFSSPATAFNSLDVEVTNKKPASKSPPYDRPGMPAGCPAHTKYINELIVFPHLRHPGHSGFDT